MLFNYMCIHYILICMSVYNIHHKVVQIMHWIKNSFNNERFLNTDGPRSSLRLLQGQLAEDGCPEAQVALAKQLLNETENGRLSAT
jgi:hypothetical protein